MISWSNSTFREARVDDYKLNTHPQICPHTVHYSRHSDQAPTLWTSYLNNSQSLSNNPITDIKTGVDEPYKIVAKVTGAPELTFYKDGVPIPEDPRIKMVKKDAETFELNFTKTAVEDNGNWAVIARNQHGEMSQFFTFAAQMLPKFENKLADAEANESKQVVLKCKINCTPRPTIQWFKNGQEITKDPRVKCYADPNGNDCAQYTDPFWP